MAWHSPSQPPIEPMLAKAADGLPTDDGWLFEPKWDGFRALVFRDGDEVYTQSRDLKPLDRYFPELAEPLRAALPERCVLDGEVVIARDGALDFEALLLRIHPAASRVKMLAAESPASYVAWDLLALGDEDLRAVPQGERRARLEAVLGDARPPVHLTPATRDRATAADWFDRFEGAGLDGVVAKRLDAPYQPGKRAMLKIKHQRTADCVVAGFRWHKNGPGTHIGSLLLGLFDDDGRLNHVGITSSFTWDRRAALAEELAPLRENALDGHPWREWAEWAGWGDAEASGQRLPGATSRWNRGKDLSWEPLRAERVAEVAYDHLQGDRFRHATTFKRWRPDKPPGGLPLRPARGDRTVPARPDLRWRGMTTSTRSRRRWLDQRPASRGTRAARTDGARRGRVADAGDRGRRDRTSGAARASTTSTRCSIRRSRTSSTSRVPPHRSVAIGERLVERGIPFLIEKPLSADGRRAAAPGRRDRSRRPRRRGRLSPAGARHPDGDPRAPGGRARPGSSSPAGSTPRRHRPGGAASTRAAARSSSRPPTCTTWRGCSSARPRSSARRRRAIRRASPPEVDVADATAAVLRFERGAIGSFANSRRIASAVIEVEFVSDGLLTTLHKRPERGQGDWHARFDDGTTVRSIRAMADPYETQAAAFFDAVEAGDPTRVLSTYADALKTDRLTRAVVAATGAPG